MGLRAHCDGCDGDLSVQHALNCKKRGQVIQRHNEIRDSLADICAMVYSEIVREPIVREAGLDARWLIWITATTSYGAY